MGNSNPCLKIVTKLFYKSQLSHKGQEPFGFPLKLPKIGFDTGVTLPLPKPDPTRLFVCPHLLISNSTSTLTTAQQRVACFLPLSLASL